MAILPIVTYNDPILRKETKPIQENSESLQRLIDEMFETMYNSNGVGLAAPQIGQDIQLFVMDADVMTEEHENEENLGPLVFINPEILAKEGEKIKMEEGCLSIPEVRDDVARPERITVSFQNRDFETEQMTVSGWVSRVIQHEYDHLQGILFLDYLSAFRRRLHRSALKKIQNGRQETKYPVAAKKVTEQG
jgi:peptide deformylase